MFYLPRLGLEHASLRFPSDSEGKGSLRLTQSTASVCLIPPQIYLIPHLFSNGSRGGLEPCSVLILVDLNTQKGFPPIFCSFSVHPQGNCLQPSDPEHSRNLSGIFCLFVVVISYLLGLNGAWMVHARLVIMLFDVTMMQLKAESSTRVRPGPHV